MDAAQAPKKAPVLADFAGIQDEGERGKMQVELYKLRAEEYWERYQNARSVEWNTLFQVYAAYAGLAVAFKYIFDEGKATHPKLICILAVIATTIFYAASRYLNYRVQERLLIFDTTRENYLRQLDVAFNIPEANPGRRSLGDRYFWTFRTHLILSTVTFVGLLCYEVSKCMLTKDTSWWTLSTLLVFAFRLVFFLVAIGLKWVPYIRFR